jgi:tetratricopeptide (TPR) repeat protein
MIVSRASRAWIAALVLGWSPSASAQTSRPGVEQAGQQFNKGVELFRAGNYREALEAFRQAHRIAPNFRVLYNIGSTALLIGDYVTALDAFTRYLAQGGDQVPPSRREQVEGHLRRLKQKVAWLRISTNVAGAQVRVDGKSVGTTPLPAAIAVNPGEHEVVASKDPAPPASQQLSVASGERHAVRLVIVDLAVVAGSRPAAPRRKRYTKFWISAGATGLLAAGTVVLGVLALSAQSDLEDELGKYPASAPAIEDARDRTDGLALATDLMLGASVIAAGLSVYFLITERRGGEEPTTHQARTVHFGPGLVSLRGRF